MLRPTPISTRTDTHLPYTTLFRSLGFKSMPTAYATLKGFEVMRALRKGQAQEWCLQPGIMGEVRLVERAFGLGPSALTDTMIMLNKHFANAAYSPNWVTPRGRPPCLQQRHHASLAPCTIGRAHA